MKKDIQISDDPIEADVDRKQARFLWFSEVAMVGMCVVVFFGFLTVLIRAFFPEGSSLIGDPDGNDFADKSWSGDVELGLDSAGGAVEQLFAGEILNIQRRVQHRGANTLTWNDANIGDKVVRNDAVQAFARSTAVMEVNHDSRFTMG